MMNSVAATSPSPLPFVPAVPDDATASVDGPAGFAKALDRAAQAQDSHANRRAGRTRRDDTEPDSPSAAERAAKGKRLPRAPTAQPRESASALAAPSDEAALPEAGEPASQEAQDSTQSDAAALALLDLASLMAGLARAARGATENGEAADAAHASALDATVAAGSRATAQHRGEKAVAHADAALAQGQDALIAASRGIEGRTLAPADLVAAVATLQGNGAGRQVFDSAVGSPLAQAAGAAPLAPAAPPVGDTAAMFQAELAAALGTPEFASALGAQVSVLIRDGVSQARLHLNPADMGPIAVHIRLDGDNAQVDFSALQALTRQALEDAVPALASALRESGLTLSGGGVFEQPPQPEPRDRSSDHAHAHRAADGSLSRADADNRSAAAGGISRGTRARGIVDVYA